MFGLSQEASDPKGDNLFNWWHGRTPHFFFLGGGVPPAHLDVSPVETGSVLFASVGTKRGLPCSLYYEIFGEGPQKILFIMGSPPTTTTTRELGNEWECSCSPLMPLGHLCLFVT